MTVSSLVKSNSYCNFGKTPLLRRCGCGVDHFADLRDAIGRKSAQFRMTTNDLLVLREIDAVGLVRCDVGFEPLNLVSECDQCFAGLGCGGLQFLALERPDLRYL